MIALKKIVLYFSFVFLYICWHYVGLTIAIQMTSCASLSLALKIWFGGGRNNCKALMVNFVKS